MIIRNILIIEAVESRNHPSGMSEQGKQNIVKESNSHSVIIYFLPWTKQN